jgi:hypothetical protein
MFQNLVDELAKTCDPALLVPMVAASAKFEYSSKLGSKEIYYLEAFVATMMEMVVGQRHGRDRN